MRQRDRDVRRAGDALDGRAGFFFGAAAGAGPRFGGAGSSAWASGELFGTTRKSTMYSPTSSAPCATGRGC